MKKNFLGIVFVSLLTTISGFGQKPAVVLDNDPGWKKIGETTASFKMQNESIEVLGADEFTAIKLKVTDAPLNIERLQVFYESGEMEEVNIASNITAGSESRVVNLKHPDRDINKVAFTYKTSANAAGEKADVELYGLKTNQPSGSDSYREERRDAEKAADEVETETEAAADEVERDVNETGRETDAEAKDTESDLERAAENVGDNVAEGVNDAAAAIKDKKVKGKVGPGGETAYRDDDGRYYYINNEGTKIFITKMQLKDDPEKD